MARGASPVRVPPGPGSRPCANPCRTGLRLLRSKFCEIRVRDVWHAVGSLPPTGVRPPAGRTDKGTEGRLNERQSTHIPGSMAGRGRRGRGLRLGNRVQQRFRDRRGGELEHRVHMRRHYIDTFVQHVDDVDVVFDRHDDHPIVVVVVVVLGFIFIIVFVVIGCHRRGPPRRRLDLRHDRRIRLRPELPAEHRLCRRLDRHGVRRGMFLRQRRDQRVGEGRVRRGVHPAQSCGPHPEQLQLPVDRGTLRRRRGLRAAAGLGSVRRGGEVRHGLALGKLRPAFVRRVIRAFLRVAASQADAGLGRFRRPRARRERIHRRRTCERRRGSSIDPPPLRRHSSRARVLTKPTRDLSPFFSLPDERIAQKIRQKRLSIRQLSSPWRTYSPP